MKTDQPTINGHVVKFHYSPYQQGKARYTFASIRAKAISEVFSEEGFYISMSRCDPEDNFCKKRGRAIAFARLKQFANEKGSYGSRLNDYIVFTHGTVANGKIVLAPDFMDYCYDDWKLARKRTSREHFEKMTQDIPVDGVVEDDGYYNDETYRPPFIEHNPFK